MFQRGDIVEYKLDGSIYIVEEDTGGVLTFSTILETSTDRFRCCESRNCRKIGHVEEGSKAE